MRIVVAECTIDYDGRLTAHLPMATRLVMVKADGCVAVHADGGAYKPLTRTDNARPILCNHVLAPARIAAPVFSTRFACDLPASGMIPAEDTETERSRLVAVAW